MSSSKVSYLVSEASGPYFKHVLANDVKTSETPFTLQYDETTNAQVNKQLDIKIGIGICPLPSLKLLYIIYKPILWVMQQVNR